MWPVPFNTLWGINHRFPRWRHPYPPVTAVHLKAFNRRLKKCNVFNVGGDDGDVVGGRFHQKDTGGLRDPLGLKRLARHALQAEPQGLRCRPLTGKYPLRLGKR